LRTGYQIGLVIDKDIKSHAKGIYPPKYSPETCSWVTKGENASFGLKCPKTDLDYQNYLRLKVKGKIKILD